MSETDRPAAEVPVTVVPSSAPVTTAPVPNTVSIAKSEPAQNATPSWGWFGGLIKQSGSLLQEVQGGLAEFVSVVKEDTSKQAHEVEKRIVSAQIVESVSRGIATLIQPNAEEQNLEGSQNKAVFSDRKNAELEDLRRDPATYLTDPPDTEDLASFQKTFKLSTKTEEISKLLSNNTAVRALHSRLVPAVVDHDAFWLRYYYRVAQLDREDTQRRTLLAGATGNDQEDIAWDDDDEAPVIVESNPSPEPVIVESNPSPVVVEAEPQVEPAPSPEPPDIEDLSDWE